MELLLPYKDVFDKYLASQYFDKEPINLYAPINYILGIGGKRIRPLLLLMACESVGGESMAAMDGAMAVELFHNFTLLHDDIMDNAPLRRGYPTVHQKYDTNTAILSGDAMMIQAYQYLSSLEGGAAFVKIFSKMAIEVCEGQQLDMDFETRSDVSIADYIEMIRLKTSVLIGVSLQIGALIGGASRQTAQHLYHYGVNIGIAFQIQDDLLDTYGTPKLGKQKCGDIIQNKKTYLYLKAVELASENEKLELKKQYKSVLEDSTEKVAYVLEIFKSTNVRGYSEELKLVYKELANSHLQASCLESPQRKRFEEFGDYLIGRSS